MLKTPAILSTATTKRHAVEGEDLKPYFESEKRSQLFSNALLVIERTLVECYFLKSSVDAVEVKDSFFNHLGSNRCANSN